MRQTAAVLAKDHASVAAGRPPAGGDVEVRALGAAE